MSFQSLSEAGKNLGKPSDVPVVVMQVIGKGEQSTHYGNNVVMADGQYAVSLVINKTKIGFKINLTGAPDNGMEGMPSH
jgi:hypothetical protein